MNEEIIQSNKIKLIRGQRGSYGWEITQLSFDLEALKTLNDELDKTYGINKSMLELSNEKD